MKKLIFPFLLLFVSAFFAACDKIENPIQNQVGEGSPIDTLNPDTTTVIKKILVEDFTGHTCGNCPEAAKVAEQLQQLYGKKIIVVSVHAGFFARPKSATVGKYTTDFRTIAGEQYDDLWVKVKGNPNGAVNRSKVINNDLVINPNSWGEAIELLKNASPDLKIKIKTSYDPQNRVLNTTVTTSALNSLAGNYKLVLYLLEDNITDWQTDYSFPSGEQDRSDYLHRHVLRDNINGTWGEEIISGSFAEGESVEKKYSNYILKQNWKEKNCSVVAYVYKADTYEIIQAEEIYVNK